MLFCVKIMKYEKLAAQYRAEIDNLKIRIQQIKNNKKSRSQRDYKRIELLENEILELADSAVALEKKCLIIQRKNGKEKEHKS